MSFNEEKAPARDVESTTSSQTDEVAAHEGVKAIEATHKVYGRYTKWFLFVG